MELNFHPHGTKFSSAWNYIFVRMNFFILRCCELAFRRKLFIDKKCRNKDKIMYICFLMMNE